MGSDVVAGLYGHVDAGGLPPIETGPDREHDPPGAAARPCQEAHEAGPAHPVLVELLQHHLIEERAGADAGRSRSARGKISVPCPQDIRPLPRDRNAAPPRETERAEGHLGSQTRRSRMESGRLIAVHAVAALVGISANGAMAAPPDRVGDDAFVCPVLKLSEQAAENTGRGSERASTDLPPETPAARTRSTATSRSTPQ